VVASDRGAIPEVVADAGLLCDAEDEHALARHLAALLTDAGLAERLRARGFTRAASFLWSTTARRTLECYARALEAPGPRAEHSMTLPAGSSEH